MKKELFFNYRIPIGKLKMMNLPKPTESNDLMYLLHWNTIEKHPWWISISKKNNIVEIYRANETTIRNNSEKMYYTVEIKNDSRHQLVVSPMLKKVLDLNVEEDKKFYDEFLIYIKEFEVHPIKVLLDEIHQIHSFNAVVENEIVKRKLSDY
jgi:hypothetical protein